jgi:alkaline phosphatase D
MINRRQVLTRAASATSLFYAASGGSRIFGGKAFGSTESDDFGVASGEPAPDSVTLWTRIPAAFQLSSNIVVTCTVATASDFNPSSVVGRFRHETSIASDFTVRLRATGLNPGAIYFYRFTSDTGFTSVTGRTKTAPLPSSAEPIKFAVVSCQNFTEGYFLPYNAISAGTFDFILHLGDFIYEKGSSGVRNDTIGGGEATTLEHYRQKYKLYLTDPYLKEARRLFPFIHLWDDHEVVNNYAGPTLAATDPDRMKGGYQAFYEFNPVAGTPLFDGDVPYAPMTRALRFGKHLELFALDQRQFRDPVVCGRDLVVQRCDEALSPTRTMIGRDQTNWLLDSMSASSADWKFVASELMMMPVRTPKIPLFNRLADGQNESGNTFLTLDSWDGYPSERRKIIDAWTRRALKDIVVCSGDIHNFFAGTIHTNPDDPSSPGIASELTTASITSKGMSEWLGSAATAVARRGIARQNDHIKFLDLTSRGYIEVEVRPDNIAGRMIGFNTIQTTTGRPFVLKEFGVQRGVPGVRV